MAWRLSRQNPGQPIRNDADNMLLLTAALHTFYIRSLVPVLYLVDGHLSTLSDYLRRVLRKLLQVGFVARLAGHCCQCFMPHYVLLIVVFYALAQKRLLLPLSKANLAQHEADLVLQQSRRFLVMLLAQELAEDEFGFLVSKIPQEV